MFRACEFVQKEGIETIIIIIKSQNAPVMSQRVLKVVPRYVADADETKKPNAILGTAPVCAVDHHSLWPESSPNQDRGEGFTSSANQLGCTDVPRL